MAFYRELPNQNRLTGLNTLAYMGTEASTPPQFSIQKRPPTPTDYQNFKIGSIWLEQPTGLLWILVAKTDIYGTGGTVGTPHYATWNSLSGEINFLVADDANPIYAASDGHINMFGGGASNITTEGINANTLNINVVQAPIFQSVTIKDFQAPAAQGIVINDATGLLTVSTGLDNQVMTMHAGVTKWVDIVSANGSIVISESADPLHIGGINLQTLYPRTLLNGDDSLDVTPDAVTGIVNVDGLDCVQTERTAVDTLSIGFTDSPIQAADEAYVIIGGGPAGTSDWGYIYSSDLSIAVTPGIDGGGMPYINMTSVGGGAGFAGLIDDAAATVIPNGASKIVVASAVQDGDHLLFTEKDGVDPSQINIGLNYPTPAVGTKGQVMITSSVGAPAWAHLQVAGGLTLTEGDNTILLTQTAGGPGSVGALTGDNAAQATPDAFGFINVLGSGSISTSAAGSTLTLSVAESSVAGGIIIGQGPGLPSIEGEIISSDSSCTITYGTTLGVPHLDITASSFAGLKDELGVTAAPDVAFKVNVIGDGLIYTEKTAASELTVGINGTGVTDGMVLIGNTLTGVPEWNTITGAGGITVSNTNGHITLTGSGGVASGIITLDLDSGTASDTGTHVVRLEGGTNNTGFDQSILANQYINIYTRSAAAELAEVVMTDSIMLHATNSTGTQGLYRLGTADFMHAYGTNNTFLGGSAGNRTLTVASSTANTGLGAGSLSSLTTGAYNTVCGRGAGTSISTAGYNSIFGAGAAPLLVSSNYNAIFGYASGDKINIGVANTLLGARTGTNLTSGDDNVFIGYYSGFDVSTGNNNIYIARKNKSNTSNHICIGLQGSHTDNLTAGIYGSTPTPAAPQRIVTIDSIGKLTSLSATGTSGQVLMNNGTTPGWGDVIAGTNITLVKTASSITISTGTGDVAFMAIQAATVNNVTGDGSEYVLGTSSAMSTSEYDIGSAFYPGDGAGTACKFTAPINGLYELKMSVLLSGIPAPVPPVPATRVDPLDIKIYTAAGALKRIYSNVNPVIWYQFGGQQTLFLNSTVQMDATDYAKFSIATYYNSGAKVLDITGGIVSSAATTYVAGYLIAKL